MARSHRGLCNPPAQAQTRHEDTMRHHDNEHGGEWLPCQLSDGSNTSHERVLIADKMVVCDETEDGAVSEHTLVEDLCASCISDMEQHSKHGFPDAQQFTHLQEIDPDKDAEYNTICLPADTLVLQSIFSRCTNIQQYTRRTSSSVRKTLSPSTSAMATPSFLNSSSVANLSPPTRRSDCSMCCVVGPLALENMIDFIIGAAVLMKALTGELPCLEWGGMKSGGETMRRKRGKLAKTSKPRGTSQPARNKCERSPTAFPLSVCPLR